MKNHFLDCKVCVICTADIDAGKAGVGKDAASATKMSLEEAHKILGTAESAPLEEILKVREQKTQS